MANFPSNISKEHILKAIEKIDDEGVPVGASSSTYDVVFEGERYPPKLVVSYANLFANGVVLDRGSFHGGKTQPAFKLLERLNFQIMDKQKNNVSYQSFDIYPHIKQFVKQAKTDNLKYAHYPKKAYGLDFKASFGQGLQAHIPWVSLTGSGQTTSSGIYPVYLLIKECNCLLLAYGISEENEPMLRWPTLRVLTVRQYLKDEYQMDVPRYGESFVFKAYKLDEALNEEEINQDALKIVDEYKNLLNEKLTGAVNEPEQENALKNTGTLNQILYGPPGTGKTYHTINKALEVLDPEYLEKNINDRALLNERFRELKDQKRIGFVTFHQSFSYEDFVEGIKAETKGDKLNYTVEEGVFKTMCTDAAPEIEKGTHTGVDLKDKTIWKMSLGNTLGEDYGIFDLCIDNNEIRLGYGKSLDFSGCDSKEAITDHFVEASFDVDTKDFAVSAVHNFKNNMLLGDIVIITDGNLKFRAIAEISSEYFHSSNEFSEHYVQTRSVIWHKVFERSLPYERIMNKKFSQMTIYKPSLKAINIENLQELLAPDNELVEGDNTHAALKPRVLIIDEINRGNISGIFGELITLIEPSKRAGADEALSVTLPYSKEPFSVPANLHLIGTMNTADRSLALMDTALRRRFDFVEMMPEPSLLEDVDVEGIDIKLMLETLNKRIEVLYDREHTLGHAFFMPLKHAPAEKKLEMLKDIFANKILPLLEEYFFEDWEKIRLVLGDNQEHKKDREELQFIKVLSQGYDTVSLFGDADLDSYALGTDDVKVYARNDEALNNVEAYKGIYA